MKLVGSRPFVWPPIASVADACPAVPYLQHTAMYNTGSGGRPCCSRKVVYHTQETVVKTRNATQSAPLSSPSCVSSKGPPVSGTWKSEREKQGTAVPRFSILFHHCLPSLSHDRSIQAWGLMELTHAAFCSCGGFSLCWEKLIFEGSYGRGIAY